MSSKKTWTKPLKSNKSSTPLSRVVSIRRSTWFAAELSEKRNSLKVCFGTQSKLKLANCAGVIGSTDKKIISIDNRRSTIDLDSP